jgi:hypothetical protein
MRSELHASSSSWWVEGRSPLMVRGFVVTTYQQWWPVFFYRFVDPRSRVGDRANYADRFKSADVRLGFGRIAVYHVPAQATLGYD